jgi:hypothetical protein
MTFEEQVSKAAMDLMMQGVPYGEAVSLAGTEVAMSRLQAEVDRPTPSTPAARTSTTRPS